MSLKPVYNILQKIAEESSTLKKIKIIEENKNNDQFKKVVFYALDYSKVYNISNLEFQLRCRMVSDNNQEIFDCLDYLSTKNGATDDDKLKLSMLAADDSETREVVTRIIRKDLRCGASIKTFLKVFPDLPYFEMMTCSSDINKFIKLADKTGSPIYWSPKKDGVRTWGINLGNRQVRYLSRSGLSYFNFQRFNEEICQLSTMVGELANIPYETPIDGEMIIEGGNFQDVMRNVRTLEEHDVNFQFNVFDVAYNKKPFYRRYSWLRSIFDLVDFKYLKLLEHKEVEEGYTAENLNEIMNSAVENGDEGIVLKLGNSPYEFKEKSKYWCKMKPVETYDLLVIGTYQGRKGKKFDGTLGGLIVKFHDKEVRVGSGFSEEERKLFLENPPKLIEVNCKGVTEDGSLREPRFIQVRDDKLTTTDED